VTVVLGVSQSPRKLATTIKTSKNFREGVADVHF